MKTTTQLNRLILLFFIFTFSFFIHVKAQGTITTVAGTPGTAGFSGNGGPATAAGYSGNGGPATSARFSTVSGFAIDRAGNLYIVDRGNDCIRIVSTSGIVTLYAGVRIAGFSGDGGPATSAELQVPEGAAVDASGNVYIADRNNNRIRKVNTSGIISTIAGNGFAGFSGDGSSATNAELDLPYKVAVDTSSNLYIADEANNRIRKVTISSGIISTIAGNGVASFSGDGGQATSAEIKGPEDVIFDKLNNMFIADALNERVRKVNLATGIISTVAGNGHGGFSGAGGPATSAELDSPTCVAIDSLNNLYLGMQTGEEVSYVVLWLRIIASATANVTCHGGTNGGASVTASLGTAPYTYSWAPGGGTNSSKTGLSAGTYSVYINDSHGVTGSTTVVITQPESPLTVSANTTANVTCYGGNNGSVTCTPSGGTMPYTYLWSSSVTATNQTATGLSAGTYTIYLTDAHGCTATASTVVLQPAQLTAIVAQASNNKCAGATDGMALAAASGGIKPYTYSWAPTGGTKAEATGLGAGTYTVYITDANGCTCSATDVISSPSALTITTTNISSLVYAATTGGIPPYTYTWTPGGSTTALLTGISAGTYTVVVEDANGCLDSVVVNETITMTTNDSMYRFPRWSKRGVYLENACTTIDAPANLTAFVDYVRLNQIKYVLLDGTSWYGGPCETFGQDSVYVYPPNATLLENFIDSVKTRGNVEQVGVVVFDDTINNPHLDSNAYSVLVFNVNNFTRSVSMYNSGLPWNKKVDVLSMDEEFWNQNYFPSLTSSVNDFHKVHMQMLKDMYNAAHEDEFLDSCPKNYLMVEDYIAPPLDPYYSDSADKNWTQTMEIDSICHYADRILLSSYTYYANVLWNRNDWVEGYKAIGSDSINNGHNNYYKKEVWPVFGAENYSEPGPACYEDPTTNFSGAWMRTPAHIETPDSLEEIYYDSLSFSMEHYVWTPDNLSNPVPMHGDTCFQVEGEMWFQYQCLELFNFDTNTITGARHFYVDLGHDTLWTGSNILTAKVNGGVPPYLYIWYDQDRNDLIVQGPDTNRLFIAPMPGRYFVLAIDANFKTAMDYVSVYQDCIYTSVNSIKNPDISFIIYPNPASSLLNIEMEIDQPGNYYFDMYDVIGRKVISEKLRNGEKDNIINIRNLQCGLYLCRITNLNGKLIKSSKVEVIR